MSRWLSLNSDVKVTQNHVHTSESRKRETRLKESVVDASPPGHNAILLSLHRGLCFTANGPG